MPTVLQSIQSIFGLSRWKSEVGTSKERGKDVEFMMITDQQRDKNKKDSWPWKSVIS